MKIITQKFIWPDKTSLSRGSFEIIKNLKAAGYDAYIAGGAVRDVLLKRKIREIDIATSAKPEELNIIFKKTIPTGEKHGTITIVHKNKNHYEVTTFRKEGEYINSRKPKKVKFINSSEQDAKRRDFTINSLFYDTDEKKIIDYAGGTVDLEKNIIKTVGAPKERFSEDALRMLRAVRFATVLGFQIEQGTKKAILKHKKNIKKISGERVKQELDKIILSDDASKGVELLSKTGLLKEILPEIYLLKGVKQPKNQHSEGDVYKHTLLALDQINHDFDLEMRYALLFHDLGKAITRKIRTVRGKRIATFYNHQIKSSEMTKKICKRLKFSSKSTDKIVWLVKNHHVPFDVSGMKLSTKRKWAMQPDFDKLFKVFMADVRASIPQSGVSIKITREFRQWKKILSDLKNKPELNKTLLTGDEVMKIKNINSGPCVGKYLKIIKEKQLAGEIKNKSEAKKFLKKFSNCV